MFRVRDALAFQTTGYQRKPIYLTMAITNNLILQNAKGSIGKSIVIKKYGEKTVISKYPDMSGVKYNERQKQEQSRFAEAVAYARSIIHDPAKKAEYQKKLPKGKRVYNAALQEFLKRNDCA